MAETSSTGTTVRDKAQETMTNVSSQARETAASMGQKAESALSSVGESMSSLAGTIRDKAPREGMIGGAAESVAESLQSGGRYLQEHGLSEMADDVATLIRRHPVPALCIAFGAGWLIGMASRR